MRCVCGGSAPSNPISQPSIHLVAMLGPGKSGDSSLSRPQKRTARQLSCLRLGQVVQARVRHGSGLGLGSSLAPWWLLSQCEPTTTVCCTCARRISSAGWVRERTTMMVHLESMPYAFRKCEGPLGPLCARLADFGPWAQPQPRGSPSWRLRFSLVAAALWRSPAAL